MKDIDQSKRIRNPPKRLIEELGPQEHAKIALAAQESTLEQTSRSYIEASQNKKWREAIQDTLVSLMSNNTWSIVEKPASANLVSTKWIFKIKKFKDGQVDKSKARLVARGFNQRRGIDFFEIFSGVVRLETFSIYSRNTGG